MINIKRKIKRIPIVAFWEMYLQFDHWTDAQRKRVLEDLLSKCKSKQLEFTGKFNAMTGLRWGIELT